MQIRNIAIIAHVDHGKTTLVDALLRQSGAFRENQRVSERALDSNDLERERGITILAKCTSLEWDGVRINIVDTPGHADFGGEVERILTMVDGVLILVDGAEGVLPQTKFVTGKALKLGLRPIVVINKLDRSDSRPDDVLNEIFDLFVTLEATEDQLDFPVLYAAGRSGWADETLTGTRRDMRPLFDLVVRHVPPPAVVPNMPFRMLATTLESDAFLGRLLTGRISSGHISSNDSVKALSRSGNDIEQTRVTKLLAFRGLDRVSLDRAEAGDIVAIAGFKSATVSDTLCAQTNTQPIESLAIDPPTFAVTISVNDSPFSGLEGVKITSRVIQERLGLEAEGNVALEIREAGTSDSFEVAGRGELQLSILIENMRREGFELAISRPRVLYKSNPMTGDRLEPFEDVIVDVEQEHSGAVVEKLSNRKCEMRGMTPFGGDRLRLVFYAPSRGLIGYQGEFLTDTRGTGIMNRQFNEYGPYIGPIEGRRTGVLVSTQQGKAASYALWLLEDRGAIFIDPGARVYQGMIIGEHARGNDLDVNPLRAKQLTNMRAAGKDEAVRLTTPHRLTLEQAIAYIEDDELVEVTPKTIRLRKRFLSPQDRKREARLASKPQENIRTELPNDTFPLKPHSA